MKIYWNWCEYLYLLLKCKTGSFLFINTLIFGIAGFLVWYLLHFFCLNNPEDMICFAGYFAVLPGYLGGLFYFMRKD